MAKFRKIVCFVSVLEMCKTAAVWDGKYIYGNQTGIVTTYCSDAKFPWQTTAYISHIHPFLASFQSNLGKLTYKSSIMRRLKGVNFR